MAATIEITGAGMTPNPVSAGEEFVLSVVIGDLAVYLDGSLYLDGTVNLDGYRDDLTACLDGSYYLDGAITANGYICLT